MVGSGGLDYKHVFPLLVAKDLRDSSLVKYAGFEEGNTYLSQYELLLELTLNDFRYTEGVSFYGFSLPGDLLWFVGLPAGKVGVDAKIGWRLIEQLSGGVLEQGDVSISESLPVGLYYNGGSLPGGIRVINEKCLPILSRQIVTGVAQAISANPSEHWTSLKDNHVRWRVAQGESIPYETSRNNEPIVPPPTPSVRSEPTIWKSGSSRQVWALCVGISDYKFDTVPPLPYASKDAELIREWFVDKDAISVPQENVHVLCNEQATRENVMTQIDWLRRHAMPEDLVVLYFAGHGAPEVAPDGQSVDAKYLVLYDTDPENLFASALSLDELTRRLDMIKAKTQAVLLECCYSGPVGKEVLAKSPTADLEIRPRQIQEMGSRPGRIILSASGGRQVALSSPDFEGGLFTHYLLEGLGDGDKCLIRDCYEDIWDAVRRKANLMGSWQEPQKFGDANIDIVFR